MGVAFQNSPNLVDETERAEAQRRLRLLASTADERFDRITRVAQRLFRCDIAVVTFTDDSHQWVKSTICMRPEHVTRCLAFAAQAMAQDVPLVINDAKGDARLTGGPVPAMPAAAIRFFAGYPIRSLAGHKIGTLSVGDGLPREFDSDDAAALVDLARMVEAEVHRHELAVRERELQHSLRDAEHRATTDALTQLLNREAIMRRMHEYLQARHAQGRGATVGLIDVDHFKRINDKHGHGVGDQVLIEIAARLRKALRPGDLLGRYGGEEFLFVLPDCDESQAAAICERLRRVVADEPMLTASGPLRVTISAGVYSGPVVADGDDVTVGAADRALYQSKKRGRNRVTATHSLLVG